MGKNAFAHEAGIHQDGVLKNPMTYEIMTPQSVGIPKNKIVLGKHSGRHALKNRLEELNFDLSREQIDEVYHRFVQLADEKKIVRDKELVALVTETESSWNGNGNGSRYNGQFSISQIQDYMSVY